jgi:predicted nucleotidyltransferase
LTRRPRHPSDKFKQRCIRSYHIGLETSCEEHPSGSFAKGKENKSGTDIDLFVSLLYDVTETLKEIYTELHDRLKESGYDGRWG